MGAAGAEIAAASAACWGASSVAAGIKTRIQTVPVHTHFAHGYQPLDVSSVAEHLSRTSGALFCVAVLERLWCLRNHVATHPNGLAQCALIAHDQV